MGDSGSADPDSPQHSTRAARYDYYASSTGDWHAYHRHACSNYDQLISSLARESPLDRVMYAVIRQRIETLLDAMAEAQGVEIDPAY